MLSTDEVIIVEGRYDKNTLSQVINAEIIETSGFAIYNNTQLQKMLRRIVESRMLVVMTDSDHSGFQIRNYIKSIIPAERLRHAYIPDIAGKEKRKTHASKEGKLGVEGMKPDVIIRALTGAGVVFNEMGPGAMPLSEPITKTDLFKLGLSGGPNSSEKRRKLTKMLDIPENISTNALLPVLNIFYERRDFIDLIEMLDDMQNDARP